VYINALMAAARALAVKYQSPNYGLLTARPSGSAYIMAAFIVNLYKINCVRD
jgi:hypothetical protein